MNTAFWHSTDDATLPDTYVAFRGRFHLATAGEVELHITGASWYQAYLDGRPLLEGPPRYALEVPEYQTQRLALPAGNHVLAFEAHHLGVENRLFRTTPPFLWVELRQSDTLLAIAWRGEILRGPWRGFRRTAPQLGWVEWRDTRKDPLDWQQPAFDDSAWPAVRFNATSLPAPIPAEISPVQTFVHTLRPCAAGPLAYRFGHATDDPSFAFFSRDRVGNDLPPDGVWRRYDLGRVRLGRASVRLNVPAGTIVQLALCEELFEGRVTPHIPFSLGYTTNLDHFIARGGEQVFQPLTPKGGRFLEVHVLGDITDNCFLEETFLERGYHEPAEAAFSCGDALLERIWSVGLETYRACAEDVVIDCPTRERGEWVGDALAPMEIASLAYRDLRLFKRCLVHAARCARADGLVAGLAPGGLGFLPTYAMLWPGIAVRYVQHTGDRSLLNELWEPALKNMAALRAHWRAGEGLHNVPGWNFIDWGHTREDPADTCCNLFYLHALRSMTTWAQMLDREEHATFAAQTDELFALLRQRVSARLADGGWSALGYHPTALALLLRVITPDEENAALDHLAAHMRSCFPNDRTAPRHRDTRTPIKRVITPYFAHHVLPLFVERGRMDFVLEQMRSCWGYMLENGRTTWLEVFDSRWSHCHAWSGSPTWILSRYVLGLNPRFDLGPAHYELRLCAGSLPRASGRLVHPSGGWINVSWERRGDRLEFQLRTGHPLTLRLASGEVHTVDTRIDLSLAPA